MYDLVITNGICVTASDVAPLDIAIQGEKIAFLAPAGSLSDQGTRVIDAAGGYIMPGGIDCHVHLQEPSMFGKGSSADDYESGTRSAIAGGNTTIVTFAPLQKNDPSSTPLSVVKDTLALTNGQCYCDFGFHVLLGTASPQALSEFPKLREEGISSVKIYMTYQALQMKDGEILSVLLAARENKILTMIHAENGEVLDWLTNQLEAAKLFAPKYHSNSRPPILEAEATNRAIALSSLIANTPILLVHVSDVGATARIREAQSQGQPIFAETCPQYLFLTRDDLDKPGFEGAKCVCSPPPRDKADQEAIWTGLDNGTFAILSSDHCPFRYEDAETGKKTCISEEYPVGQFKYIPNGIPGVETRMPLTMSAEKLELTKLVQVTSTNAAKLYGLYPRKGALIPGVSDADLTIWYPGKLDVTVKNEMLHHDCDYSPYEGHRVNNWPRYTILRGQVVWDRDNGGIVGRKGYGQFIKRGAGTGVWKSPETKFDLEML
ncbi:putative allantoinase [Aspergillus egyptiacus]|nr:putative allantoinase [Aspergillus egyptiacus]